MDPNLTKSWHDSAWIPNLNRFNVLDYFSERSNPFYDRTCNNETIKMQRLNPEQLRNLTGLEYIVLHVQEPILYVIRKQHRTTQDQATPLANYYIIDGIVYQAPDLGSVLSSRLVNAVHYLESAFEEAQSCSRYHPSRGYYWLFGKEQEKAEKGVEEKKRKKEEMSSQFQRHRVDELLAELARKFPPRILPSIEPAPQSEPKTQVELKQEITSIKQEIKIERPDNDRTLSSSQNRALGPPAEKKQKLSR